MEQKVGRVVHSDDRLCCFFHSLVEDRPDLAKEILDQMYPMIGN